MTSPLIVAIAFVGYLGASCSLVCLHLDKIVPLNYILLAIITACQNFLVGSTVMKVDIPKIILQSTLLTLGATAGIIMYAATTKRDFTILRPLMFVSFMVFSISTIFIILYGL